MSSSSDSHVTPSASSHRANPKINWNTIAAIAAIGAALGASLAGVAAVISLYFTRQSLHVTDGQLQIAQQQQVTNEYTTAITDLGSNSIDIRVGGVYALQPLMDVSPSERTTVVAVLCAFIRDQSAASFSAWRPQDLASYPSPADVQAALSVLSGLSARYRVQDGRSTVYLGSAQLVNADLFHVNLSEMDLLDANLTGASLIGGDLYHANLAGAYLIRAHTKPGQHADLERAILIGADLSRALLYGANLGHANFLDADLSRTVLAGANLTDANLAGANLADANLAGANIKGARFSYANLTDAIWPLAGKVPTYWIRDPRTGRLKRVKHDR
jgi:uncharacterized protein YjbI with pentapeptide repeats